MGEEGILGNEELAFGDHVLWIGCDKTETGWLEELANWGERPATSPFLGE